MDDSSGRVTRQRRTAPSGMTEPITDQTLPGDTDRRALELRAEIAATRGEMAETIEAIQERLSPAHLAAQASETVRNAATEKVKQMANTAGDAMDSVLGSTFMDTVRANPVPAAMIGLGAVWLFAKRRPEASPYDHNRGSQRPTGYPSREHEYGAVGTRGTFGSVSSAGIADQAVGMVEDARDVTRRTTQRAQLQFDDVLRNNPLALSAAAAVIGAVVGLSAPRTETENHFMGDARDSVVDQAYGLANDAADRVKDVAGEVQTVASDAMDKATAPSPQGRAEA